MDLWLADTAHTPKLSGQHQPTYMGSSTADRATQRYIQCIGDHCADVTVLIPQTVKSLVALIVNTLNDSIATAHLNRSETAAPGKLLSLTEYSSDNASAFWLVLPDIY